MAYIEAQGNYVKFLRGTPAAWESITTKNPDTLYFISETNAPSGTLYLGSKLISSGISSTYSLSDLTDILMSNNIPADAVLVYNDDIGYWEPVALSEVLAQVVQEMTGATAQADGEAGLVPQPEAGDHILFLRGDGTWADPTTQLASDVEAAFVDLYAGDSGSIRSIAQDLIDDLVDGAPARLDTLKELADWVADHEQILDVTQAAADIDNLTNAMFGTVQNPAQTDAQLAQMVQTDGVIRILTNLNTIVLGDNVTTGLQARVGNLESDAVDTAAAIASLNSAMSTAQSRMTTIETNLTAVENRLRWVDVVQEANG